MDDETRILTTTPKPPPPGQRGACLVHIYPSGPNLGSRYTLGETPLVVGRDENCDICINDDSVSRRHACIQPTPQGYGVVDLQSTNGTFVNDGRVSMHQLKDGDYLRFGSGIYRFLAGGNIEAEYHEEIYRLTIIDALTEIHNKRYLIEFLGRSLSCSTRYRRPLAVAMFDIDRFKSINDQLGHLGGDYTLRELAMRIRKTVRKDDLFARYGGEEFALLLPGLDAARAAALAEEARKAIDDLMITHAEAPCGLVTISIGVASLVPRDGQPTADLVEAADNALYGAKHRGRNTVVTHTPILLSMAS